MADPRLQPLQQGVAEHYALATFLTLTFGSRDPADFCGSGVRLLATLAERSHFVPVIRVLSWVVPMFWLRGSSLTSNRE